MISLVVANEIRKQIGAKAFVMMGAKNLAGSEDGLSWKVGRNAGNGTDGRVSHITVTLDPSDTYTVEFIRCNARAKDPRKVLASHSGVYFDGLYRLIESETGMCLTMPRFVRAS